MRQSRTLLAFARLLRDTDSHVVELALLRSQTGFDIPQTLSVSQLGKCHAEILFQAEEFFDFVVAVVPIDALMEYVER